MTTSFRAFLLIVVTFVSVACSGAAGRRKATLVCQTAADCEGPDAGAAACVVAACVEGACTFTPVDEGQLCDDGNPATGGDACHKGQCMASSGTCPTPDQCQTAVTDTVTGACSTLPKQDGTACDDGDLCTQADACQNGACVGASPRVCTAKDSCHVGGTCDPATGDCDDPAAPDGTACDDGKVCTQKDSCAAGTCTGSALNCDDGKSCSTDSCDEALGGCHSDVSACACQKDTDCDDGNACNGAETCDVASSKCVPGTALDCSALTGACHTGTCDAKTGACTAAAVADGTACNDGDLCTRTDTCQSGVCTGSDPVACGAAGQCTGGGTCDPATGTCTAGNKADGTACDDANPCTTSDVCQSGACTGDLVVCTATDQCHSAGTCNPTDGVCTSPAASDGTACDDGNACTQSDACATGVCSGGTTTTCPASDACHLAGTCDPKTGACSNPAAANGSSCDDGLVCTQTDTCTAGKCAGTALACADTRACTVDTCSEALGGCTHDASTCACSSDADCDDGNACNGSETCNKSAGTCVKGTPKSCTTLDDACNTGSCSPATGACVKVPKTNGTTCTDGNACTQTDSCQAGVCVGANPVACAASDQCHSPGTCSPATGTCTNPVKTDGSACNDGSLCTQADTCQSGKCVGANPVLCTASDQCHAVGTCAPATGVCSNPPKTNGTACNDGSACTQTDTCQAGVCAGTNPVVCAASDQCHAPGTCAPATGVCSNPAKGNGTACNDNDACTQSDTCQAGACIGGSPVTCTAQDQCHGAGTCDAASGLCSNPPKANGTSCNDGNACTQTDTCQAGVCAGGNPKTCTASNQCHNAGTCSPSTGACSNPAKTDGTTCNDGNACTQTDTCVAGTCTGGNPKTCTASDQCHAVGTCAPATGVCSNPAKTDGTTCNDGDACTQTDTCQAGVCSGSNPVVCTASDQCHAVGACNSANGTCSNPAKANGSACSDGNACTTGDTCQVGACTAGAAVVCAAPDQCHTAGTCAPATGICSNPAKANGTTCSDGKVCTSADVCTAGVCGGAAVTCNDGIACTVDSCSEAAGGCTVDTSTCGCAKDADCNDGNACNGVETCNLGTLTCKTGTPVDCSTLTNACNTGTCSPASGACTATPKANGTSCNDGNACTQSDTCQSGTCTGANPVVCGAQDQCHTAGTCNTTTGVCTNPAKANGAACSDGNACTQTDTCQTGVCTGANPVACTALDQCHAVGACNTTTGVCTNPAKANGTVCSDGNACTQTDTCQTGVCTGANPVACTALDQCHAVGTCAPATGACSNPSKADGTTCNDSNACTQSDTCVSGACTGANPVACTALDQCHVAGTCAPATGVCSNPNKADGTACSDGNSCTKTDTCVTGTCTGANPVVCTALDQCHVAGTCAPATGVCSNPNKSDGSACSDSNSCTQTDTCKTGVCTGANPVVCNPLDQCHSAGTCAPATGACSNPTLPDNTTCNDGNGCTQTDVCTTGVCTGSNPIVCKALSQCYNVGTCAPATGACSNPPKPAGTICNDSNACTTGDACNGSGSCSVSNPVTCLASLNPCKVTSCDVVLGCVTNDKPDGTTCSDSSTCTQNDACLKGQCSGTTRDDKVGDWADAPGNQGSGPTSIDVLSFSDGTLGTVGVYTGTAQFGGVNLPFNPTYLQQLYFVTYKEQGTNGNGTAVSLVSIGGTGSASGIPGTFVVGGMAVSPDDSFTVVGTFSGPTDFGRAGAIISMNTGVQTMFVARYARDGSIKWLATGDAKGTVTGEAVGAFQNGSVVVSGVVGANPLTFTDSGGVNATIPAIGIYAVRFAADGTGVWAHRVATRGDPKGGMGVKAVTTHSDGSFTLLGAYTVQALLGINAEKSVGVVGGSDAWILRLESTAAYRWGGRLGGTGNERPGDVRGVDSDDVIVAVDVLGATPTLDAATTVQLHTLGGGSQETNIVRLDKAGKPLLATLVAYPKGTTQGWDVGFDSDKSITVAGVFTGPMEWFDQVGFGAGAPTGTPFTINSPTASTLYVSRYEADLTRRFTVPIGGTASGMLGQAGWDIVMAVHPSLSVTVAGMFQGQATFGDAVQKLLITADKPGSPFIVHIDSEQALDYCP